MDNKISTVSSNIAKYYTYVEMMRLYKIAYAKIYLEALWIFYALAEDRTSAFLYHIGFTAKLNRNKVCGKRSIKIDVRNICEIENNKRICFNTLGGKVSNIRRVVYWVENIEPHGRYQEELHKLLTKI